MEVKCEPQIIMDSLPVANFLSNAFTIFLVFHVMIHHSLTALYAILRNLEDYFMPAIW